jgi:hypothetical protein
LPSHRRPSSTSDLVVSECVCVKGIDWYVFPRDSAGCNKKYRVGGALGSLSALWTDSVYLIEAGAHPLRDLLRGWSKGPPHGYHRNNGSGWGVTGGEVWVQPKEEEERV